MRIVTALCLGFVLCACQTEPLEVGDGGARSDDAGSVVMDAGATDAGRAPDPDAGASDAGAPPGATCPPAAPFGEGIGDVAPDLVLMDCDGTPHTLHELCDRRAVWLFEYADWCPPCRDFASRDANRIYDRFAAGDDFAAVMIVSEDSGFGEPDAADCAAIRDRYGIRMPVLFDPGTTFEDTFGVASNEVHVVLRDGARIEWKGHYAGDQVEGRIEATLAR